MTGKLQDGGIEESVSVPTCWREDYFAYYYAYARHQASCFTPGGHRILKS